MPEMEMPVDELEAGCRLDERVAREVLRMELSPRCPGHVQVTVTGWQCRKCGRMGEGGPPESHPEHPPRCSSNLATAWPLLDRFAREGVRVEVSANAAERGSEPWRVVIAPEGAEYVGMGPTPCIAICRAALKAAAGTRG